MLLKLVKFLFVLVLAAAVFGGGGYWAWKAWFAPPQLVGAEPDAPPPPVPVEPPDPGAPLFQKALDARAAGSAEVALEALHQLLAEFPGSPKASEARRLLSEAQVAAFFRSEGEEHAVARGETLVAIASKHKTNAELIFRANNLENTVLQIGQKLRVPRGDFSIRIDRATGAVRLFRSDRFFCEYPATAHKLPAGGAGAGAVTERISWRAGQRVAFGSKEYADATRWVSVNQPPMTLYTDWESAGVADRNDARKPANGVGLAPESMDELFVLVGRGTPVRIE